MMNVTPESAHGWLGFINRLGKTKFGSGVIGFGIASGIASIIYWAFIIDLKDTIKQKNQIIESLPQRFEEVRREEKEDCIKSQREQFQLFMDQHNTIIQNNANKIQLDDVRVLTEQNRELLNELKKYRQ